MENWIVSAWNNDRRKIGYETSGNCGKPKGKKTEKWSKKKLKYHIDLLQRNIMEMKWMQAIAAAISTLCLVQWRMLNIAKNATLSTLVEGFWNAHRCLLEGLLSHRNSPHSAGTLIRPQNEKCQIMNDRKTPTSSINQHSFPYRLSHESKMVRIPFKSALSLHS